MIEIRLWSELLSKHNGTRTTVKLAPGSRISPVHKITDIYMPVFTKIGIILHC